VAPRGDRAMVTVFDPRQGTASIGLVDLERQLLTRLTVGQRQVRAGSWSPDGSRIVYAAPRGNRFALYQKSSTGGGDEEVLIENDRQMFPLGGSRDGRYLVYASDTVLYLLPLVGDRKPIAYLSGPSSGPGQISPDGRWISYVSLESGLPEVYIAPRSDSAQKVRISPAGGSAPRWRGDGRELFYLSTDSRLVAVAVDGRGEIVKVGTVEPLFGVRPSGGRYSYDVAPDGQRFLFSAQPVEDEPMATPITVVVNWTADLKR
jgi:Tol biopolymer transport system component